MRTAFVQGKVQLQQPVLHVNSAQSHETAGAHTHHDKPTSEAAAFLPPEHSL